MGPAIPNTNTNSPVAPSDRSSAVRSPRRSMRALPPFVVAPGLPLELPAILFVGL